MTRTKRLLNIYQIGAGLSDTSTGLLLVAAPAWTLQLMLLHVFPEPLEFARFIGVFVLSVGLTYLVVAAGWPLSRRHAGGAAVSSEAAWKIQWMLTAIIRGLVALFLLFEVAAKRMEPAWLTVALSDGMLAALQALGLSRGWLDHVD